MKTSDKHNKKNRREKEEEDRDYRLVGLIPSVAARL